MSIANWKNQTIWTGDNLSILRGMNSESVDLIYLDPPFNSNANYAAPVGSQAAGAAFKDTWGLDDVDLVWHVELKYNYPALYALISTARETHSASMMSYLIYMAVRLIEMKRVLKGTGSIYLHCDDTAGHYLKLMMDAVFGAKQCRGTVIWKRNSGNNAGKGYGRIADWILYYTSGDRFTWNQPYGAMSENHLKEYSHVDSDGRRYKGSDLTAPNGSSARRFTWRGTTPNSSRGWAHSKEKLEELWAAGRIHTKKDGTPSIRGHIKYLDEHPGSKIQNIWADISKVGTSRERVGYPTQKPLALLRRIILASSNAGDVVLDPFCGCATACIAAEQLGREWIGIDISSKAAELVSLRMKDELGLFYTGAHREDIPVRTDLGKLPKYNSTAHKKTLYGEQEGRCNGCGTMFEMRNLTVDHIVPKAKGGHDHLSNLQLLCGNCNSIKGTKTHEELLAALTDRGWRKRKQLTLGD